MPNPNFPKIQPIIGQLAAPLAGISVVLVAVVAPIAKAAVPKLAPAVVPIARCFNKLS